MGEKEITRRDFLKGMFAPSSNVKMTYRTDSHGENVSLLGYGMMRLPTVDGKHANGWAKGASNNAIDQDLVNRQIDYALAHGVNYFDTSPVYCRGESERVTGIALSRHPRETYRIATKLSNFHPSFHSFEKSKEMYEQSFKALQTDYIDYYLLHSIGNDGFETFSKRYLENGVLDWLTGEREKGRIRNLGFSFHGDPRAFEWCIEHNDTYKWDFCQIQMNYIDWRHAKQVNERNLDGEYLYTTLDALAIPIVIMEPLLGGRLAQFNQALAANLVPLDPEASMAKWAFRFAGHYPRVLTCLSGMTRMEHLEENCEIFSPLEPLSQTELAALERAAVAYVSGKIIPCTACDYCMPCPYGLTIPSIFKVWNTACAEGWLPDEKEQTPAEFAANRTRFLRAMDAEVPAARQPAHCVTCGLCAPHCPQTIQIPSEMVKIDQFIENLKNTIA